MFPRPSFLRWVGIRYRVGILGALGVVGVLLVGCIELAGHASEESLRRQADTAGLLDSRLSRILADLAEARGAETTYVLKVQESEAALHTLALQRASNSLEQLAKVPALGEAQRNGVRTMAEGLAIYADRADAAIRTKRMVGLMDGDGLRGRAWASGQAAHAAAIASGLPGLVEHALRARNSQQRFSLVADRAHAIATLEAIDDFARNLMQAEDELGVTGAALPVIIESYRSDAAAYVEAGLAAADAIGQSETAFEDVWATGNAGQSFAAAAARAKQEEVAAVRRRTDERTRVAIVLVASAVAGLALGIGRSIARPLSRLAHITKRLTRGDKSVRVAYLQRRDEIGEVARALAAFRDTLVANEEASDRIHKLAHFDALTGLANRVQLQRRLAEAIVSRAGGGAFAVHCLNLDGFKAVNDLHGHAAGDRLLRAVASVLSSCTRKSDVVARLGGDEFVVIQSDVAAPEEAQQFARKLTALIAAPFRLGSGVQAAVTTSIGIALFPRDGTDSDTLLRNADTALYRAKWAGKNVETLFVPEMDRDLRELRALEADLRLALKRGELALVWQPIADASDIGRIAGYEVLLRWHHPVRGPVPPDVFIPIAETCGAIQAIGEWVLQEACTEAAGWTQPRWIAVNASPLQVQQGDAFACVVESVLAETGLAPDRLTLEVTESVLISEVERVLATLRRIKALGVRIALDDFGTGYSSLATLRSFPFDKLKVDRSFIAGMTSNEQDAAIVRAVVGLAEGLGLPVVAEGVESEQQLAQLADVGCAEVQGWLIGRPGAAENLPDRACRVEPVAPDPRPHLAAA